MTVDTDALVTWLREALDEDEQASQAAAAAGPTPWSVVEGEGGPRVAAAGGDYLAENRWYGLDAMPAEVAEHIARWDPARVLAEVEAKRQILDLWETVDPGPAGLTLVEVILALAQPYASRPGFRDEWRLA